jgi:predicted O-methyltransferase YrrM
MFSHRAERGSDEVASQCASRFRCLGQRLLHEDLHGACWIREGDALRTLAADLPETVDLLLLDGAKALYPEILGLVEGRLRPGAFVIADNADYSPDYLALVRSPAKGYLSTPFAEDVELSLRIG